MIKRVLQMIKQAVLTGSDDTTLYPRGQGQYNGKITEFTRLSPYGLCTRPPDNSWVVLFSSQGQESVKFGLTDDVVNRFKNLEKGEVVIYNTLTQSYIILKSNGNVEINAKNDLVADVTGNTTLTSASITINGPVNINGTLNVSDDVIMDSDLEVSGIDFLTHVHGGVSSGTSDTGIPK